MYDTDEKSRHGVIRTVTLMDCTQESFQLNEGLNAIATRGPDEQKNCRHGDRFIGKP